MVHPIHIIPLIILSSPALACNPQWGPCAGSTGWAPIVSQPQTTGPQIDQQTQQWVRSNQQRNFQQSQANRPNVVPKGHFGGTR